jgi:alkanesulfonate monooxygenase SsuD/methylene tetrahydromethanopterin reductase-like flavin-dependent oxidoreductase (luciferase family)
MADGLAIAQRLLEAVRDYWDGRPLTHHGQHIHADLMDVLRAITPAHDPAEVPAEVPGQSANEGA